MKRRALLLTLAAPAALLFVAGGLTAQERSRPTAAPAVGRYQLVQQSGKKANLVVFDTVTGAVYGIEDGQVHSALDPVRGVCRLESVRWPEREALARELAQAILSGDGNALLRFLPEKRQLRLRSEPDARHDFDKKLAAIRARLGKDPAEATRLLLRYEPRDLEFSAAEARWLVDW